MQSPQEIQQILNAWLAQLPPGYESANTASNGQLIAEDILAHGGIFSINALNEATHRVTKNPAWQWSVPVPKTPIELKWDERIAVIGEDEARAIVNWLNDQGTAQKEGEAGLRNCIRLSKIGVSIRGLTNAQIFHNCPDLIRTNPISTFKPTATDPNHQVGVLFESSDEERKRLKLEKAKQEAAEEAKKRTEPQGPIDITEAAARKQVEDNLRLDGREYADQEEIQQLHDKLQRERKPLRVIASETTKLKQALKRKRELIRA
jgi:hypothetical protein